jgi:nitronate monooxygenase
MTIYEDNVLDYPIQNAVTQSMRKQAAIRDNNDFMSMWAGQSLYLSKACSASRLINDLVNDINHLLKLP